MVRLSDMFGNLIAALVISNDVSPARIEQAHQIYHKMEMEKCKEEIRRFEEIQKFNGASRFTETA